MDGRCATCRHWDPSDADDPEAWGGCWLAASDAVGEPVESLSLAIAQAVGYLVRHWHERGERRTLTSARR